MTRTKRRVVVTLAAACFAVASASLTSAQAVGPSDDAEGPIIIGQRRQYERLYLDRPEVALNLTNIYQRDKIKTGDTTVRAEQYFLDQVLELKTQGYLLSPNFFTLSLYGAAGVSESWTNVSSDGDSESGDNIGSVYEWDGQGTFQPNGDSPLTLFSRREQSWIFREFGPALQNTTTETGAAIELRSRIAPTRFAVSHLDAEQDGLDDTEEFAYTRDAFDWNTSYLPTQNQTITWDYTYSRVEQDGFTNQEYETQDARLRHELVFGNARQHSLESSLSYYQQSGDLDLQRFRWDERLRLIHSDDFRTRYDYTFDQTDFGGIDRNRHRATAGFTHHLFDSVTTDGEIGAQRTEAGEAVATETFADIMVNYRKQVPLGLFSANAGASWSRQDSETQTEPLQVIDQPAIFGDALPIIITGANVDPNTIIITDPSGLLLYQEGVDYTVTRFSDRIEIDRIVGGRIGAGQAALLDYQLAPLPASISTSDSWTAGLRYDFQRGPLRGLTLYGRYTEANQNIDTDVPSAFVLNEFTDTVYGLEYRIGNLTLGAEHQDHDSTINPFEADRLFARYSQRIQVNTILAFNTAYTQIEYFEPANELDLYTASVQLQHQFNPRMSGLVTLLYRHEDDAIHGRTSGFEQQLEVRWRHRQTQVFALIRNADLESSSQDRSFQFVQFGLRREF